MKNVHFGPYNYEIKSGPFFIPQLSKYLKYIFVKQESLEINNWLNHWKVLPNVTFFNITGPFYNIIHSWWPETICYDNYNHLWKFQDHWVIINGLIVKMRKLPILAVKQNHQPGLNMSQGWNRFIVWVISFKIKFIINILLQCLSHSFKFNRWLKRFYVSLYFHCVHLYINQSTLYVIYFKLIKVIIKFFIAVNTHTVYWWARRNSFQLWFRSVLLKFWFSLAVVRISISTETFVIFICLSTWLARKYGVHCSFFSKSV